MAQVTDVHRFPCSCRVWQNGRGKDVDLESYEAEGEAGCGTGSGTVYFFLGGEGGEDGDGAQMMAMRLEAPKRIVCIVAVFLKRPIGSARWALSG